MPLGSRRCCKQQQSDFVQSHFVEPLELRRLFAASAELLLNSGYLPVQHDGQQAWAKQGQWLVEFESPSTRQLVSKLNAKLATSELSAASVRFTQNLGDNRSFVVNTAADATLDDVKQSLAGLTGIKAIEPDYAIFPAAVTPNDQYFTSQWALQQTSNHDINAPEAWELSTGSPSVVIAVPDTGIDYNHVDLSTNIWKNYAEIAGNGIDDDGNGYVDDVRGWDWVNNDSNPMDDNGHGTIVAGEIGAIGNNSIGIAGVAWQVKMMPLKIIASTGLGATSLTLASINYVIKQKQAGVNIRAINASWVNNMFNQLFYDAMVQLKNNGILFVAAAGNGGDDYIGDDNDVTPVYPASYWVDNVISVAATDSSDNLANFSNYGLLTVSLAAPGVGISGTTPGNSYGASTGTSDSAPLVSGTVALAAAAVPTASYSQIKSALLAGVDQITSLHGKIASGGRLNARKALEILIPPQTGDGLLATYYNNPDFTGTSVSRTDANVGFDWNNLSPVGGINPYTYSVRWTGWVMPAASETYTFYTKADDGVRLWINGQPLINRWTDRLLANDIDGDGIVATDDFNILSANFGRTSGATFAMGDLNGDGAVNATDLSILFGSWGTVATAQEDSATITLVAGQKYSVLLEYYQNSGRAVSKLSWSSPSTPKQIIPQTRLYTTNTVPAGSPLFSNSKTDLIAPDDSVLG